MNRPRQNPPKHRNFYHLFLIAGVIVSLIGSGCDVLSTSNDDDAPTFEGDVPLTSPPMSGVSDSVSNAYRQDARMIALHYMQETDSTKVMIPEGTIEFFWKGLIHIYQYDHAARDTVVNMYPIHNPHHDAPYREIIVKVDTSYDWTRAWHNGETMTGNDVVDRQLESYSLSLNDDDNINIINQYMFVVLRSAEPVNTGALARNFEEEVADVADVTMNGLGGDGSHIRARVHKDRVTYTYSYGWGDCPAGCINQRDWRFNVFPNGSLTYDGSEGSQLPEE